MVVTMRTGQTFQTDPENCQDPCKSLSLQLYNEVGEEAGHLLVAVKNLTTAGVILEILHPDNGSKNESLKGREGLLTVMTQNDCAIIKVPGKVLWTRSHEGDRGVTLGLELLQPLPLPVRHILEADMAIGAKDMKFLWDYWDEIQESAGPPQIAESAEPAIFVQDTAVALNHEPDSDCGPDNAGKGNWLYWVGFIAIICGIALQFPQSEFLGFPGLIVMFLGSLVVAWKSVMSMWQISSAGQGT
jgi:hypothetical protein